MKKFIFLIAIIFICGCDKEDSNITPQETYLSVNLKNEQSEWSDIEKNIYLEARNRVDKVVSFENGEYRLNCNSANELNISSELFEHFKNLIKQSNSLILEDYSPIAIKRTKSNEESGGGRNGYELYWWGFEVYMSHDTLFYCGTISGVASTISAWIPEPVISKITATALCLAGVSFEVLAYNYPNGVTLSFTYPITPIVGCVLFDVAGQ